RRRRDWGCGGNAPAYRAAEAAFHIAAQAAHFYPSRGGRQKAGGVGLFSEGGNWGFLRKFSGFGGGTPNIYFLFILV
ncbi:hypothetical protein QG055_10080, partial [Kingella kingae]|uniref:hypothetical protein n=1 Tax=Kingella kingae TaxID=504 RepID=UPI002556B802